MVAAFAAASMSARAAVTMQLDQNEIRQSDTAQLTINASGNGADQITPPVVPGLEFTAVNQSSQIEVINGAMTSTSSVTYEVSAQTPGTYTIPAQDMSGKGLTLRVLPGNAPSVGVSPTGSSPVSSAPILPAPAIGSTVSTPEMLDDGAAFVRMELPKQQLYVGETVPVKIQIGLRAGVQPTLNGLPTLTSDAFTLDKLSDKPEQSQEEINGEPYIILTWESAIAAVKPGNFPLAVTAPVTIEEPTAGLGEGDDSPFGGAFFQNLLGSATKKDLTLTNSSETMHVSALPNQGQPADFSGAVGTFQVSSTITPTRAAAGDPLTLKLQIRGSGGFDRVDSTMLGTLAGWKTYPPTSKFTPADSVGYAGEKDFEQAIIPLHAGQQHVPTLSFSFFNPETRKYEVVRTNPPMVDIAPGSFPSVQGSVAASNEVANSTPATPVGLRPDEVERGVALRTLQPLYFQSGFLIGQAFLALGFLGSGIWLRRRDRLAADQHRVMRREQFKAVDGFLRTMDAAASRQDAAVFFGSARQALQHCLGPRWGMAPAAVTVAEVHSHLNGKGENVRRVFDLADQLAYSSGEDIHADFIAWKTAVHQLVKEVETL
jgi:hypothetical protein